MFERILKEIREKIRSSRYIMSVHAEEEMCDDDLSIFDVEHGILTGIIVERQKDPVTSEWKYRICGKTIDAAAIETIVKLSPTGKLIIITVYLK